MGGGVLSMIHGGTMRRGASGFGLLELMVALVISLILMAGVGTIYVNSKNAYHVQERLSRLQENGRFAMHFLMRDIRMAGYLGCFPEIESFNSTLNDPSNFYFDPTIAVEGIDDHAAGAVWYPSTSTEVPADIADGTDLIALRMVDPSTAVHIAKPMPNTSAVIDLTDVTGFSEGDIIMLSDCATGDMMQVTSVLSGSGAIKLQHNSGSGFSPGNSTQKLQKSYDENGVVFKYTTRRFYIKPNAQGVKSLYRDDNGKNEQELVEGIEDLQLTYGVDSDGDGLPNRYYRAGEAGLQTAAQWSNVVSVRFGILARSLNSSDIDTDTVEHDVNGKLVGPLNDRHQRRVFQATILLRNVGL